MAWPQHTETSRKLRMLRRQQGISMRALASLSGVSQSKISDIENGRARPTVIDVRRLTDALDLRDDVRRSFVDAVSNDRRPVEEAGDWRAVLQPQPLLLDIEAGAKVLRSSCSLGVPSWLQTPEYMATIHRKWSLRVSAAEFVSERLQRQAQVARGHIEVRVVMSEQSLLHGPVDRDHQIEQLRAIQRHHQLPGLRFGVVASNRVFNDMLLADTELAVHDVSPWTMLSTQFSTVRTLNQQFDELASEALWDEEGEALVDECIRFLQS